MIPLLILEHVLRQGRAPSQEVHYSEETWGLPHAVGRLVKALRASDFGLDHAVLLRQCLRLLQPTQPLVVESVAQAVSRYLEMVGIHRRIDGTVEAIPFTPAWLSEAQTGGVDVPALERVLEDELLPGEAWLSRRLGKDTWRSQAQREATWKALTAPTNSTLLVGLPTGAGKSLVYQVCAAFEAGLTVVVVPTVALGMDQIKALRATPIAQQLNPRLYAADDNSMEVLDAVSTRKCRLLITSPEAIVAGRLGVLLDRMSKEGWLCRFVVDEAHIVESWGASFRVEFQLLGAHLRSWRATAPSGVRTLLLSATFADGTPKVLRRLFGDDNLPWREYVIQRLRPEVHYFSPGQSIREEEQEKAVTDALLRLPRPAILYVTERKDADLWFRRLQELELRRIACFHGNTAKRDRDRILDAWRDDELDLVVATSAFGMGVDKPDVRAVVHACFPENIDRFYQEVGRGGRDGAASVSVTLWTAEDREIGAGMGPTLLSDEVKIRGRWEALWRAKETTDAPGTYKVPLDAVPNYRLHERSYDESIAWNKRLLLMMGRAGLLRITGLEIRRPDDGAQPQEWATLQMLRHTSDLEQQLPHLLKETRAAEVNALKASLQRLDELLTNSAPACRILRRHYGTYTYRACGSCASCRHGAEQPVSAMPLRFPIQQELTQPKVDIVHGPSTTFAKGEEQILLALRRVMSEGLCWRFLTGEHFYDTARRMLERACGQAGTPYRLDLLTGDSAASIRPEEIVICLHAQVIDPQSPLLHTRGALCAHWILGASAEDSDGRWPFMQEQQSRLFTGQEALNDWISSRLQQRQLPGAIQGVH
ncbi:protein DpdF [Cupriavidus necator]|uniref:protein DpdF n=1 Tax=Cupriavidus necator TaxID=106590 RepID=UPI003ECDE360